MSEIFAQLPIEAATIGMVLIALCVATRLLASVVLLATSQRHEPSVQHAASEKSGDVPSKATRPSEGVGAPSSVGISVLIGSRAQNDEFINC